jgi:hypothetical protein
MIFFDQSDGASEEEEPLETEFPLGDGTAQTSAEVYCPYCNETVEISLDAGGGESQQYVEDCEICCQPWSVKVQYHGDGSAEVSVMPLDE